MDILEYRLKITELLTMHKALDTSVIKIKSIVGDSSSFDQFRMFTKWVVCFWYTTTVSFIYLQTFYTLSATE